MAMGQHRWRLECGRGLWLPGACGQGCDLSLWSGRREGCLAEIHKGIELRSALQTRGWEPANSIPCMVSVGGGGVGQRGHFPLSTRFFLMWNPDTSKELSSATDTEMKAPKSSAPRGIGGPAGCSGGVPRRALWRCPAAVRMAIFRERAVLSGELRK